MHFSFLRKHHLLIPIAGLALAGTVTGDPPNRPAWWTDEVTRVIPPGAIENNKGPANIGQAKHMARAALLALRASGQTQIADAIEAVLVGPPVVGSPSLSPPLTSWDPPTTPAEQEKQKAPLLLGQLKAIAHPFYNQLHAAAPTWLATERATNGTNHPGSIFPWTAETTDDQNKAIANIGQLKAVFSLRLDSIPPSDSDGNGLSDSWELQHFGRIGVNPDEDEDRDGFTNFAEQAGGTDPQDQASYPPGTPLPNGAPQLVGEQLTFIGTRWGANGFQNPAKKYLKSVYHTVNTVTPGPDTWGFAGDETVTLTTDVRTGEQTRSSTDTPTTDWASLNPWIVASDVSRSHSGIHSPWGVNSNTSQILSDEYTIPTFVANVESWCPAYQNKFTVAVPWIPHYAYTPMFHTITAHISLTPEATDPYPAFYYYITKLKYKWKVNAGQSQVVSWLEVFTPADGSSLGAEAKSWAPSPTDTESPVYEIDPTTKNGKKNGTYSHLPVDLDIVHPATGEVAEGSEDSTSDYVEKGKGGYVAIRRNADTPLTKLVLRAIPNLPTTAKFRLDVDSTLSSGQIKVWKDQACTQLVTSQQTEFEIGAETTLYLEGVDHGSGGDLKIIQEIKVGETWHQGDKVSIAVVHAEIEVVLRCFIPHKWTDSEAPIPVAITYIGSFPNIIPVVVTSSTIAGDRQPYSVADYEDEPLFRLSQMLVMTPYKELHSQVDIASKRRRKAAPLTEYYEKSEDIPAADQNADFGETLAVGATPNWIYAPDPNPSANYTNPHRSGDVSKITVSLSGGPGTAPFVPDAFTPNIDWEYTISMTRMEYGSNPYIRVEVDGEHNLYPAYEVIAQESDGVFVPLYQVKPLPSILPGPNSLNVTMEANGSPIDLD